MRVTRAVSRLPRAELFVGVARAGRRRLTAEVLIAMLAAGCASAPAAAPATKPLPASIPFVAGEPLTMFTMRYQDITPGTGAAAEPRQCYYAHYTGWLLADGHKFQSSRDTNARGEVNTPFSFAQGARQVIAGWDVGFIGMKVGGTRRLIIPQQLAYGDLGQPRGHIPPRADLVFDVELLAQTDTLATADSSRVSRQRNGTLPRGPWCAKWGEAFPGK
ncbi:MAG TPA: FKBP-type peptidyl-prolyl cis-trans isomerase [Gemmatimonadales bacterium]